MSGQGLGRSLDKGVGSRSLAQRPRCWPAQGMAGLVLLLGSLLLGRIGATFAETPLSVGTSTTLPPRAEPTLPPPPQGVRQISEKTNPEETADMPLSLLAEQVLEAVCEAQIDAERALALMPDLSKSHIRAACPNRLIPKS